MGILTEIRGGQIMGELKKQLPFAISIALNRTGFEVAKDLKTEMINVFDNPSPFTLRSIRFAKADYKTKKYSFEIGLQDLALKGSEDTLSFSTSGGLRGTSKGYQNTPGNKFLYPQIYGGTRNARSSERRLREIGVMKDNQFWVKGEGARLNAYGDIAPGQIVQLLSALKAFRDDSNPDKGWLMDHNKGDKKTVGWRKSKNPLAEKLLVIKEYKNKGKLYPGIYKLTNPVKSKSGKVRYENLSPILIFMQNPTYKRRYDFFGVGQRSFDNKFENKLNEAIQYALATSK